MGTISYFRLTHLDLPQGQVTQMELPEGIYSGQVKDGIPQGVGSLTFADESVVTANFENGYATGKGRITSLTAADMWESCRKTVCGARERIPWWMQTGT